MAMGNCSTMTPRKRPSWRMWSRQRSRCRLVQQSSYVSDQAVALGGPCYLKAARVTTHQTPALHTELAEARVTTHQTPALHAALAEARVATHQTPVLHAGVAAIAG